MTTQMDGAGAHAFDDVSRWRLGRAGWRAVLRSTAREFKRDEVSNLASVLTLRIVLAIVPSIIAAVAIAAQVVSTEDIRRLVESTETLIPGDAKQFVTDALTTAGDRLRADGFTAIVISVAAGLLASSGAASVLVASLNRAFGIKEGRGFIGQRLTSLGVVGALVLALVGMFVAIVLGPTVLEYLLPRRLVEFPFSMLITLGRYVSAIAILMLFFGFAFWFGPNHPRPKLRFLTPGAVLGVTGWLLLSWLFGLYVSFSQTYSATYGAFAGVIVLLVWLNYSFTVLLMGAELDHEIDLHLGRAAAPGGSGGTPGGSGREDADRNDLDAVGGDMQRHPGLLGGRAEGGGRAGEPADDPAEPGGPARRRQVPRLVGAASQTPGAAIATRLLARLGR